MTNTRTPEEKKKCCDEAVNEAYHYISRVPLQQVHPDWGIDRGREYGWDYAFDYVFEKMREYRKIRRACNLNLSNSSNSSEAHVHPKVSEEKNQKMLDRILEQSYKITKYTILAMLEKDEKKQDEFVGKIMEATEQIEKQYSTN